ncbi:MAG TPA: YfiR family protein [Burkholderiales bacterium]|nr:YfiR family protein [Burkholderiales bacterium]
MTCPGVARQQRSRLALAALLALLAWGGMPLPVAGAAEAPDIEQRVKAAFLFKFGGYVEWPDGVFAGKDSPLVIGVAGADSMAEELTQLVAGRTMNGRSVTVRRIRAGEPVTNVHVLFVGRPEMARLGEFVAQARPVLTVTDTEKGFSQGSVINFVVADNRVRFEVSLDAARRNGLKIGAPLLSVAMRVQG